MTTKAIEAGAVVNCHDLNLSRTRYIVVCPTFNFTAIFGRLTPASNNFRASPSHGGLTFARVLFAASRRSIFIPATARPIADLLIPSCAAISSIVIFFRRNARADFSQSATGEHFRSHTSDFRALKKSDGRERLSAQIAVGAGEGQAELSDTCGGLLLRCLDHKAALRGDGYIRRNPVEFSHVDLPSLMSRQ